MLLVYSYYLVDFYNAFQWTLSTMTSKNKNGGDSWGTLYGRPMERLAIRYDRHEEIANYIRMWHIYYHAMVMRVFRLHLKIFGCFCYSRCHRVSSSTLVLNSRD